MALLDSTHAHDVGFWQGYIELVTDPGHWMLEITVHLLIDLVILGLAWPLIKKKIAKHDKEVHGHKH